MNTHTHLTVAGFSTPAQQQGVCTPYHEYQHPLPSLLFFTSLFHTNVSFLFSLNPNRCFRLLHAQVNSLLRPSTAPASKLTARDGREVAERAQRSRGRHQRGSQQHTHHTQQSGSAPFRAVRDPSIRPHVRSQQGGSARQLRERAKPNPGATSRTLYEPDSQHEHVHAWPGGTPASHSGDGGGARATVTVADPVQEGEPFFLVRR